MKKNKFNQHIFILKILHIPLGFFLSVLLSSCSKDPCQDIICLNGASCIDGKCQCVEGYSGEHCDDYDLCYKVVCPAAGGCEFGECLPPKKVRITKIEVTRFPGMKPMNIPWDQAMPPDNNPDIFPHILKDSTLVWVSPSFILNAIPGTAFSFFPNPAIEIQESQAQYSIGLMDGDSPSPPEPMGKLFFVPYVAGNNFPQVVEVDEGGIMAFRLTLSYIWD